MPRGKSLPGGHAPGQGFTRGGMPRGKGLPGGACHGARDFTRGGIAPGQGFLPGGALPPYAPPVATSLIEHAHYFQLGITLKNYSNIKISDFKGGTSVSPLCGLSRNQLPHV